MQHFVDGDMVVITWDDFINLQESPVVFIPLVSDEGQIIVTEGIRSLALGDLIDLKQRLEKETLRKCG